MSSTPETKATMSSHQTKWLLSDRWMMTIAGEEVGKREPLSIADRR
jgi:hypothetical protein